MERYELSEALKPLYTSTKRTPFFVEVPTFGYLTFNGNGHPAEEDFQIACEALYTLSYIIKFKIVRNKLDIDYKVSPMEVSWYLDKSEEKINFSWTMMIRQPEFVTEAMIHEAIDLAKQSGKEIAYDRVAYRKIEFGKCIQCFHLGDYNKMNDTLATMIEFARRNGLSCDQYTHDIYLNDMRKTKMENYKTIMRIRTYKTS